MIASYASVGAAVWAILGAGLGTIQLRAVALLGAALYALAFGIAEVCGRRLRRGDVGWQVPASWIKQRHWATQQGVWALLLGAGMATRNPYVSFWLVFLLLAASPSGLEGLYAGAMVGALHGGARAVGVALNASQRKSPLELVLLQMRLRQVDGAASVMVGACALHAIVSSH